MNFGLIVPYSILAMIFGIMAWMWINIIRGIIQRRRDWREGQQRCHETIKKFKAKGKIEGPKGTYKPKRWGTKWVEYSNELPAPRANSQQLSHFPELPTIPTKEDE